MSPKSKEPTRGQLTKGLGYQENVPSFLRALHARVNNPYGNNDDDDEDAPRTERPPIPTRPEGEGSGDEESGEEKPQVVVLREGKHLSELEAENEKRRAKGLAPLPEKTDTVPDGDEQPPAESSKSLKDKPPKGLSFGSGKAPSTKDKKRKVIGDDWEDAKDVAAQGRGKKTKKTKKESKGLLSFGDGDE